MLQRLALSSTDNKFCFRPTVNSIQSITHVLDRLSFGPRSNERQQVQRQGVEAYIRAQLNPLSLSEPASLSKKLRELSTLNLSPIELSNYGLSKNTRLPATKKRQKTKRKSGAQQVLQEAVQARLLRAIESPRQLQEVMVDFWFNHFNISVDKGLVKLWTGSYEQTAIRPHALGKFRDLLGATAKHPAMLFYLDNWLNTDPNSRSARGRFKGLNENYARELLELHTLGVNGGYAQADVESLTRILTGWSLVRRGQKSPDASGFIFVPNRHDSSNKILLGQMIPGEGIDARRKGARFTGSTPRHSPSR